VLLEDRWYDGVANIGVRPTFSGDGERIEVHLFEWCGAALYGRRIEVAFIERLRDERRCASLAELRELIAADCVAARGILAQEPVPVSRQLTK
jgi:riboflavin kinase/FMN adenylyltransferase